MLLLACAGAPAVDSSSAAADSSVADSAPPPSGLDTNTLTCADDTWTASVHLDADEVLLHAWDPATGQPAGSTTLGGGPAWSGALELACEDRMVLALVARSDGVLAGHHTHWTDPGLLDQLGVGFDEASEELELRATSSEVLDSVRFYVWSLEEGGSLGALLLRSDDGLSWSTAIHHHQLGNDFDARQLFPGDQRHLGVFVGLDGEGFRGHAVPMP